MTNIRSTPPPTALQVVLHHRTTRSLLKGVLLISGLLAVHIWVM